MIDAPDKNSIIPFARWLSDEANEASSVKRDTPVMVVLGNPPYSGISQNNGKWITDLIEDYKYVDGVHFKEKKHWLQDDYVKFIRYGQEFVEKNGEGILAYINNHSFLDNPTFRGMRWSLLQTFDEIYILDLHGNARKKEVAPDGGGKDENVFDIQQGVSINIFVKTGKKGKGRFADVLHYDLYGDRNTKYETLQRNTIATIKWERINCQTPYFFFVPKNDDSKEEYEKGFGINQLFPENVTGIVTMGDNFIIADDEDILKDRISKLINSEYNKTLLDNKFNLGKNYSKWIIGNKPQIKLDKSKFVKINYRPFDVRWTYFDNKLVWRLREKVMQHFLKGENVGLMVCRQQKTDGFYHCLIHNNIVESSFVSNKTSEIGYSFPLYLYSKSNKLFVDKKRKPNLNINIVNEIAQRIGLQYTEEKEPTENTFAPIDIIDYIYAVLHSPAYREQYKEFLKIDFPRVPYPQDAAQFRTLVAFGAKLRKLHLLEGVEPVKDIATYPKEGSNKVEKPDYADGKVWINDVQYFEYVPREAWEFYIGGYQPAQKWLKDRKGRQLGYEDIRHYQKMIMVLLETSEIQKELNTQKIYIKI
ncbi:hypothetical protein EZS27_023755 [termite gut metagenome]|uniref:site-specific DNA-methyltransferase (adenine-specific) n=1 Tax=termite gut metagenome TaxID=433724 RepID=A0A5J4R1L3_9ZZZZ